VVVRETWTASPSFNFTLLSVPDHSKNALSVERGQEGFVLGDPYIDITGYKWRQFVLARSDSTDTKGWVRSDLLEVGQIAGNITIIDEGKQQPIPHPKLPSGLSVLEKTVTMLVSAFVEDRDAFLADGASSIGFDTISKQGTKITESFLRGTQNQDTMATTEYARIGGTDLSSTQKYFTESLILGMPTAMKKALNDGGCSFDALWSLPRDGTHDVRHKPDERPLLYLLIFKNLKRSYEHTNGKYGGKTVNAGNRLTQHRNYLKDPTASGHMYNRARGAEDMRMLAISDLISVPEVQRADVMQVAEQIVVCLFGTITSVLLSDKVLRGDAAGQVGKYYLDRVAAKRFAAISKDVFARSGWQPPPGVGLNWSSPMMEVIIQHTYWTCQEVPLTNQNTVRIYRRSPLTVGELSEGFTSSNRLILFAGGNDRRGTIYITPPQTIPAGTKVTPVVEIYQGENRRHPFSFANCPEPGPWSDWKFQNRVGIRLEWRDTKGNLVTEWCQAQGDHFSTLGWSKKDIDDAPDSYAHVSELYVKVQCIYNTLMQVEYPPNETMLPWIKQGPAIIVKEFKYNHLKQELRIVDQQPTRLPMPKLVDFKHNELLLWQMYGPNLMVGERGRPSKGLAKNDPTREVLCCFCQRLGRHELVHEINKCRSADYGKCNRRPNPDSQGKADSCVPCFFMRRPCVWVPVVDLEKIGGRFQYIRVPHHKVLTQYQLAGPSTEGATAEEVEESRDLK
jgi:hypothetical protein